MTVRHVLIGLNLIAVVAIAAYIIWAVLSPKRASTEIEPANLTPFLPDDDLESRRLERVQGWALLFAAVVAIALPLYWLHEPSRQKESANYFTQNAAERGEVLFSNPSMPKYEAAQSLQCANCHGATGTGGQVKTVINGKSVVWQAPPLNTVLLRFQEDPGCANPETAPSSICEVTSIITYGRPGTPMQPWGVEGGGPKNDQSIQDIVAFLRTLQLSPARAQAQATKAVAAAQSTDPKTICPQYMTCPVVQEDAARATLKTDTATLAVSRKAAQKALDLPDATDAQLDTACADIAKQVKVDASKIKKQALACEAYTTDAQTVKDDQDALDWSVTWAKWRANVSEGQLLFELNCARCHTQGWSTFDSSVPPTDPGGAASLGLPAGGGGRGGGVGPNLRDRGEIRRFGSDESGGFESQVEFVQTGSIPNKEYGNNGNGTGRMPGFAKMLKKSDIEKIVSYERYCVDSSTFTQTDPACETGTGPRVTPTTTTQAPKG